MTHRKKFIKRFAAFALVATCCTFSIPVSAYAEDDVSSAEAADFEEDSGGSEGVSSEEESESSGEVSADETESTAEEGNQEESANTEEAGSSADAETITSTATVDADGNVETETVEGTDGDAVSDDDGGLSLETFSTSINSDGDSSETEDEAETETTYSLSITVSTTARSSSDSSVRKVKVSKPKLTTTVTNAETGEVISSTTKTYGLTVKCNVVGEGWSTASSSGNYYTFDAGSSKYVQSVRFSPSSSLTSAMKTAGLSFCYRAKTKYFGTLDWATPGASAGTAGNKCPLTGIELKVIDADKVSSLETTDRFISAPIVQYQTKKNGSSSWSSAKTNGSTSGGTSSALGALKIKLSTEYHRLSGDIQYSVRSSSNDSKWTSWKSNNSSAGSSSSKLKAIRVRLTGDMEDEYNVYYRVYVKGYGWLGWAKNGEKAGTKGLDLAITAVQIKLVPKGQDAPGSTSLHYIGSSNAKMAMVAKAQNYSSSTNYLILVNRSARRVGIFTGSKGNWKLKYYWECCVGKSSTPTPSGSYTVGIRKYSFGTSSYTCYYATQFSGNYLFHSVLYYPGTFKVKDGTMGKAVSHGCVRLSLSHAKWIYNNIPRKTKVRIY